MQGEYKPFAGPCWVPAARVGDVVAFGGERWTATEVEDYAFGGPRVIHWVAKDGRKARTEAMPTHPNYPRDLTPAERKLEAAREDFYKRCGFRPSKNWRP